MDRTLLKNKFAEQGIRTKEVRGDYDLNPTMERNKQSLTPAAVLVPLVLRQGNMTVMLTRRTNTLAHHPGQVSFPGGHIDPKDISATDAALRETEEEVGIERKHVEVIGELDTYMTRTGFSVTPIVGIVTPPFEVIPDPIEVAEIFEVPISFFMDKDNHKKHSRKFEGIDRQFYAMPYNKYFIWGATAGMLINLYDVLKSIRA